MKKAILVGICLMLVTIGLLSGCTTRTQTSRFDIDDIEQETPPIDIDDVDDTNVNEYTTFEVEQLDIIFDFNQDTFTEDFWMEVSVRNTGDVTVTDVIIRFEVENSYGYIMIDKTVKTLEMQPNEVFGGTIDLSVTSPSWIDINDINSVTTISYENPNGIHDTIKISNILYKHSTASADVPLYSLEK